MYSLPPRLHLVTILAALAVSGCEACDQAQTTPQDAAAAAFVDSGAIESGLADRDERDADADPIDSSTVDSSATDSATSLPDADTDVDAATSDAADAAVADAAVADSAVADAADASVEDAGPTPTYTQCTSPAECDDDSACTADSCEQGACIHSAPDECDWPAEPGSEVTNLTDIEGPIWDNDFYSDLSGAVYNPVSERLWVVRNNGPSKVWAVVQEPSGDYIIDERGGERGEWESFGDAEAVAQADFADEFIVFVLNEGGSIGEYDLSVYGEKNLLNTFSIQADGGNNGPEGMTFVPDAFLAAGGFVDGNGAPYVSTQGMGGLMFVGLQAGGAVNAYDLNRVTGEVIFVGEYLTGEQETAALEFDRSTGQLFIWHDASIDVLEVTGLSSTDVGAGRQLDTLVTYGAPSTTLLQTTNREGFAVAPVDECVDGKRRAWMTTDGGNAYSLLLFLDFPC